MLDRLKQIKPKWVFVDDASIYNGRTVDLRGKMGEIVEGMEGERDFQGVVSLPRFEEPKEVEGMRMVRGLGEFLAGLRVEERFERVGFGEGFLIVYSSGYV